MRRLSTWVLALLLLVPGIAGAQDRSPIPDHWLTLDSLSAALGLPPQRQAHVKQEYEAINQVLQAAAQRRSELRSSLQGTGRVAGMSETERQELNARLLAIRTEYEGRQADLEQKLAAVRALLTTEEQLRFDALAKPRVIPER